MKFIDLFCGIGGFRIGFEKYGYECVFSSDFNKVSQDVYEANFGERPHGDITKINADIIPDFDILLGGFPCQPFSSYGKKAGFNDTRGTLFYEICRIAKDKQPKIILLENVEHIIHHDNKKTFQVILDALKELDYNVTYKVINANVCGLPQNRSRVFIMATKEGVFNFDMLTYSPHVSLKDFLNNANDLNFLPKNDYTLIDTEYIKTSHKSGMMFVGYRNKFKLRGSTYEVNINTNTAHSNTARIYSDEGCHPTLVTGSSYYIYRSCIDQVRKLAIDEAYRIQGFPENFIRHQSNSPAFKHIGNSVSPIITGMLAEQLLKQDFV